MISIASISVVEVVGGWFGDDFLFPSCLIETVHEFVAECIGCFQVLFLRDMMSDTGWEIEGINGVIF